MLLTGGHLRADCEHICHYCESLYAVPGRGQMGTEARTAVVAGWLGLESPHGAANAAAAHSNLERRAASQGLQMADRKLSSAGYTSTV